MSLEITNYLLIAITIIVSVLSIFLLLKYRDLKKKDNALAKAFEISREGIYYMDLLAHKTKLGDGYYRLLGYQPNEISVNPNTWMELVHPEDREWVSKSYENVEVKEDTFISIEYRLLTKDRQYIWVLDRSKVVAYGDSGQAQKSIGTIIQIDKLKDVEKQLQERNNQLETALTELKESQTQLIEMEKTATLGLLTSGIANELNNPLNYVKGDVHPLKADFKELSEFVTVLRDHEEFKRSSMT